MHYRPAYPDTNAARDRFVVDLRGPRSVHDPWKYQDIQLENEVTERGAMARVGTIFLTGRECPWRCAMCDLWRYTTRTDTPAGAIPAQIKAARDVWRQQAQTITRLKLYNASNFFDSHAVPEADYAEIAALVSGLDCVTVESHPALIGDRVDRFRAQLDVVSLEVAMGLETVHPKALEALNKRMTTDDFSRAAQTLARFGIALRVFLLIAPPFVPTDEQDEWLLRSVSFAEECGASAISLIPTRSGNGTMEALTAQGLFHEPTQADVERSVGVVRARASSSESRVPSPEPRAPRILLDPWAANAR